MNKKELLIRAGAIERIKEKIENAKKEESKENPGFQKLILEGLRHRLQKNKDILEGHEIEYSKEEVKQLIEEIEDSAVYGHDKSIYTGYLKKLL